MWKFRATLKGNKHTKLVAQIYQTIPPPASQDSKCNIQLLSAHCVTVFRTFLFVYSDLHQSVETTGSLDRLLNKLSTTVPQVGSEAVGGLCYMSLHTSMGNKPLMKFNGWDRKVFQRLKNRVVRTKTKHSQSVPDQLQTALSFPQTSLVSDPWTKQHEKAPLPSRSPWHEPVVHVDRSNQKDGGLQ